MKQVKDRYQKELLAVLKLFKKSMVLDFSYEERNGSWDLFIHLSSGVIQIRGDEAHTLKNVIYASPIIESTL